MSTYLPQLLIMLFCLVFSGYFSATETAFSTASRPRLRAMAEEGNRRAALAENLANHYDKMLTTILVGNNIVNIGLSSISTLLFVDIMGSADLGATMSTIVSTVVVLIFGEISPKSIARETPETFAMFSAPLLRVLMFILTPINWLFTQWKKLLQKVLKLESKSGMSSAELRMLVEEAQEEGGLDENEGTLLQNAISFTDLEASEVMTHRVDLTAVPVDAQRDQVAAAFAETHFSRLPVYEGSVDNIVGLLHQKDFFTPTGITEKSVRELMSKPLFISPGEHIGPLLRRLQKEKTHMAVVLDEFGGTYGIVTMEDILEELVGEIQDEHDQEEATIREENGGWVVDCDLRPDEFFELFDIDYNKSDSPTMSGWLMDQLGHIPELGDTVEEEGLRIKVCEVEPHRASFVFVTRLDPQPSDEPDEK